MPNVSSEQAPQVKESALTRMNVQVDEIVVDGGFADMSESTMLLLFQYSRHRINGEQIYQLAAALEQAYVKAGYLLARITVPAQTLRDGGLLHLRVIDGYIESVDVTQVPERVRAVTARRVQVLIGRRGLRTAQIERAVLLAGAVAGVQLRSTLVPGVAEGSAQLVLSARHQSIAGSLSIDNRLSRASGPWKVALSLGGNSLLGFGEQVYGFGEASSLNEPRHLAQPLAVLGGGVVIPLTANGLSLNLEYTDAITHSRAQSQVPATRGVFERATLRLAQPLVLDWRSSVDLSLTVEDILQRIELPQFHIDSNEDHYRAARLQLSQQQRFDAGAESASMTLSHGLGGRSAQQVAASHVPLSREGADPNFTILSGRLELIRVFSTVRLRGTVLAQAAFGRALFRSEQFALEGPEALSAFAPGSLPVDQGVAGRLQLEWPRQLPWVAGASATPYLLVAKGVGHVNRPTAFEARSIQGSAYGAGVNGLWFAHGGSPVQLTAELARGQASVDSVRSGWYGQMSAVGRF